MLRGFDGGDIALKTGQRRTEIPARLAENPPVVAVALAPVGVAADQTPLVVSSLLHGFDEVGVDLGKSITDLNRSMT